MIKLQAIGHLGKDATVNQVNGQHVVNFSVCHTEKFKDSQGNVKEKSIWVECAKWSSSEQAVAKYLLKGTQVYVEGSPEVKTFSKNDGSTGHSLTLRVFDLQLLGGKKDGGNGQQATPAQQTDQQPAQKDQAGYKPVPNASGELVDDLPF